MANYTSLLDGDIDKFEELFMYKKKYIEEFVLILEERAELEDNYAKGLSKIANNFGILLEKGSISNPINSFKSYHLLKSDQSKILANSIRTDIVHCLKEFVKTQALESKKILSETRRYDLVMRANLDRLEKTKSRFMKNSKELDEITLIKEAFDNMEIKDVMMEDRKNKANAKYQYLINEKEDSDKQLKQAVDEFNSYKDTFTSQINKLREYFRDLDKQRLNNVKDSIMKCIVYEISYLRNLQYDIDKIVQAVDNVDFDKDITINPFYTPKANIPPMSFNDFKELMEKNLKAIKNNDIVFERNEVSGDLGLGFAWKSVVDFFSNKEDKKKNEERGKAFLSQFVKVFSEGKEFSEKDEQLAFKLLTEQKYRKYFLSIIFSQWKLTNEIPVGTLNILKRILTCFLDECYKQEDWQLGNELFQQIKRAETKSDSDNKYISLESYFKSHKITKSSRFWELYIIDCISNEWISKSDNSNNDNNNNNNTEKNTIPKREDDIAKRKDLLSLLIGYFGEMSNQRIDKETLNIVLLNMIRNYNLAEDEAKYLNDKIEETKKLQKFESNTSIDSKSNDIEPIKKDKEFGRIIFSKINKNPL